MAPKLSLASPSVRPLTGGVVPPGHEQVRRRLGDIASDIAGRGRAGADRAVRLAVNRAISPNSVTGISLLLGLCAAAWFSGGTRQDDVRGLITVGVWVVVRAWARRLAAVLPRRAGRAVRGGRSRQREPAALTRGDYPPDPPGQSDWLVLPGFNWSADDLPEQPSLGQSAISQSEIENSEIRNSGIRNFEMRKSDSGLSDSGKSDVGVGVGVGGGREFGWLYAVCATAGECAIYGGVAAGAESAGWTATWPLAVAIVIVGSVTAIARSCGAAAKDAAPPGPTSDERGGKAAGLSGKTTRVSGLLAKLTFPSIGVRVLLAALVMVGYGPRIALVAVLTVVVVSLAITLSRTGGLMAAGRRAAAASAAGRAATSAIQDVLLACRDDGPLARRAGWLVRGNLMPVPPATAGLVAIGLLTLLGIKNLPGIVALTPVVVLLLAAPGSSHPHDGRFDWLVPVLLCIAQYCYLVAFGAAKSVPWLLVFTACSMTAIWYASLVASRAIAKPPHTRTRLSRRARVSQIMARRTEGIGWDGRVGLVGLAGMFGIATFGYLGLTACLGALICRRMVIDYLGEDRRQ